MDNEVVIETSKEWILKFVIKHNICPFAKRVFENDRIEYCVETNSTFENMLMAMFDHLEAVKSDTAFIIYPFQFPDFLEFLDFYYACEAILEDSEYDDQYQLVAFHPQYLFAGEEPEDPSHLTNRSPYPMIHILKRDDVAKAIASYGDTSDIAQRNIAYLRSLHSDEK